MILVHFDFPLHKYNTFCGYPPEIVKKMPKKELAEEVMTILII